MATAARRLEPITREGYDRLCAELETLTTIRRRQVADDLREAREDGGEPGENLAVAVALDDQAALERRIDDLTATLATVAIADPPVPGVAGIGQRVLIRVGGATAPVGYELVGAVEADPARRRISIESPIGQALVGRRAGDVVQVQTPGGERTVELLEVGAREGEQPVAA